MFACVRSGLGAIAPAFSRCSVPVVCVKVCVVLRFAMITSSAFLGTGICFSYLSFSYRHLYSPTGTPHSCGQARTYLLAGLSGQQSTVPAGLHEHETRGGRRPRRPPASRAARSFARPPAFRCVGRPPPTTVCTGGAVAAAGLRHRSGGVLLGDVWAVPATVY